MDHVACHPLPPPPPPNPHPRVTSCFPSPTVNFPEDLHCTKVTIVSEEQCRRIYPNSITPNMVCAGESRSRADSCQVGGRSRPSPVVVVVVVVVVDCGCGHGP